MIDFEIDHVSQSTSIIRVRGDLDGSTRDYFFDCISDLLGDCGEETNKIKNVIVECNGLGILSSSGMAALLTSRKNAEKRGTKIYLTHLNSTVAKALEITKLNSLLAVYPTTEELLETLDVG
jgi:anti-anti-sigma factor